MKNARPSIIGGLLSIVVPAALTLTLAPAAKAQPPVASEINAGQKATASYMYRMMKIVVPEGYDNFSRVGTTNAGRRYGYLIKYGSSTTPGGPVTQTYTPAAWSYVAGWSEVTLPQGSALPTGFSSYTMNDRYDVVMNVKNKLTLRSGANGRETILRAYTYGNMALTYDRSVITPIAGPVPAVWDGAQQLTMLPIPAENDTVENMKASNDGSYIAATLGTFGVNGAVVPAKNAVWAKTENGNYRRTTAPRLSGDAELSWVQAINSAGTFLMQSGGKSEGPAKFSLVNFNNSLLFSASGVAVDINDANWTVSNGNDRQPYLYQPAKGNFPLASLVERPSGETIDLTGCSVEAITAKGDIYINDGRNASWIPYYLQRIK